MELSLELARLSSGENVDVDTTSLMDATICVTCDGDARHVLERLKEVLHCAITAGGGEDAETLLPEWFVASCSSELSDGEVETMLRSPAGFERLSHIWTPNGFSYWFRPDQRSWYWWDGRVIDPDTLHIELKVEGFPFAWGALAFLLEAAGGKEIRV